MRHRGPRHSMNYDQRPYGWYFHDFMFSKHKTDNFNRMSHRNYQTLFIDRMAEFMDDNNVGVEQKVLLLSAIPSILEVEHFKIHMAKSRFILSEDGNRVLVQMVLHYKRLQIYVWFAIYQTVRIVIHHPANAFVFDQRYSKDFSNVSIICTELQEVLEKTIRLIDIRREELDSQKLDSK